MQWPDMRLKTALILGGVLLLFCGFKLVIGATVCSSFFRVTLDARFDQAECVQVYYGLRPVFDEKHVRGSALFPAGERQSTSVTINNHVARYLRLDLGEHPGRVQLYGLRLTSFFFPERHFSAAQIAAAFAPGPGVDMQLNGDHVAISSSTEDPYLVVQGPLTHQGLFYSWLLPLLMAMAGIVLLSSFSPRSFPPIADLLGQKRSSAGLHFAVLDGIRGAAALLVLAEHIGLVPGGVGVVGVLLFFALSGFLLAIPFARNPERAITLEYMRAYMRRRLLRIIPMYYTVISILFLFRYKNPDMIRHYLFLQGDAYLWTVPQEMFFYVLLPFIVVLVALAMKIKKWLGPLLLLAGLVVMNHLSHQGLATLYGNGEGRPALIGVFMSGMFFSWLYQWLREQPFWQGRYGTCCRRCLGLAGLAVLLLLLILGFQLAPGLGSVDIYSNYGVNGFLAAFVLFSAVASGPSLLVAVMSWLPFRAVGIVSFSFYLLHPSLITLCDELAGYYGNWSMGVVTRFLAVGLLSYAFAAVTYAYVERPFMK